MIIEIRPYIEKQLLKGRIIRLRTELGLEKAHKIPHLTLVYQFIPKIPPYRIAEIIRRTAQRFPKMGFTYNGWELEKGEGGWVFGFKIIPNDQLKRFRCELYDSLKDHINEDPRTSKFNKRSVDDYWFHSAVAFHMNDKAASKVKAFIKDKSGDYVPTGLFSILKDKTPRYKIKPVFINGEVIRIPLIRKGKIAYEYDTVIDKILNRDEALSKYYKKQTILAYRQKEGLEIKTQEHKKKETIWLISDTHFDHTNIIKYTARPFFNSEDMNGVLVKNWNNVVSSKDTVYHLGDVSFGTGSRPMDYWLKQLNGNLICISSNHTDGLKLKEKIEYKGHKFLLVHDPKDAKGFDGWVIHGHTHNNELLQYPFINFKNKTINVGVELIRYRPISLDDICTIIKSDKNKENIMFLQDGST
jgi:calcineurin-like phosphoesterase family protein